MHLQRLIAGGALCVVVSLSLSAHEVAIPVVNGIAGSRVFRTTVVAANRSKSDARCTFAYRRPGRPGSPLISEETIAAGETRVYEDFLVEVAAAGSVRVDCSAGVDIVTRLQESGDGGKTFRNGRVFRPFSTEEVIKQGVQRTMRAASDLAIAEVEGQPAHVEVSAANFGGVEYAHVSYDIPAYALRIVDLAPAFAKLSASDVTITVTGKGAVIVGKEAREPALANIALHRTQGGKAQQTTAAYTPNGSSITALLGVSAFKGAPFIEPMTGDVYMRDRWYEPRTGSFLTPDPEGFGESANLYSYCHGDPVNCSDPTGRLGDGGDLRADFRAKEQAERQRRAAAWCRANPVECAKRDVRGRAIMRGIGAAGQTAAGAAVFASSGSVPEPVTKTLGTVTMARGLDNLGTAATELWTGESRDTLSGHALYVALRKGGKSPREAAKISGWTETGVDVATTLASGTVSAINTRLAAAATPQGVPGVSALRFGNDDLVYGPSARGYLRALQQEAGGVLLDDIPKPPNVSWEEFTMQTLDNAASSGRSVRFDLTHVEDLPGVLHNSGEWANTITGHELRYLQSNWSRFRGVTHFYRNGVEVGASWVK
jgi:RHS repeat-associated protein